MKKGISRSLLAALLTVVLVTGVFTGCGGGTDPVEPTTTPTTTPTTAPTTAPTAGPTTTPSTTPTAAPYQWPKAMHVLAIGTSGQTKAVSWANVMKNDTGMSIPIQMEESYAHGARLMKQQEFDLVGFSTSTVGSQIEAVDDFALKDGGPWMPALVWANSYGSTGFIVRADSDIYTPHDLKAGMKMAVSSRTTGMERMYASLLAWGNLTLDDMFWVPSGSTAAAVRAVTDGRADFAMAPPTGSYIYEAVSSPKSARYISLDPSDDEDGAARFQTIGPMYGFGPIRSGPPEVKGTWAVSGPRGYYTHYDSDPDLMYNVAKWFDENLELFADKYDSNRFMTLDILIEGIAEAFVPVHPGLQRYLEEKGVWNETYAARSQYNKELIQSYIDHYPKAIAAAEAQGITVLPSDEKWREFWENYKRDQGLVMVAKHPSLEENAPRLVSPGYAPPKPEPEVVTKPEGLTGDVWIEVISATGCKPDSECTAVIKTEAGAAVVLVNQLPGTGTVSANPPDTPLIADADGMVTFVFPIHWRSRTGEATWTITATLNGKEGQLVHKIDY